MYENPMSYKTKQQNLLRSKTQSFLKKYHESSERVKSRSSMHKLAKTIYSIKQNEEITPKKLASRSTSLSKSLLSNPQLQQSQVIKGLSMRVSHVPNYSDINTQLIIQKRNLQERISFLKANINKQRKLFDQANTNIKKLTNQIQRSNNGNKQFSIKSERANEGIQQANDDCLSLKSNLRKMKAENKAVCLQISRQYGYCEKYETKCKNLKNRLLIEEKLRVNLKNQLIKQQKSMNSLSVLTKELEHQRAVLLLEINKTVSQIIRG